MVEKHGILTPAQVDRRWPGRASTPSFPEAVLGGEPCTGSSSARCSSCRPSRRTRSGCPRSACSARCAPHRAPGRWPGPVGDQRGPALRPPGGARRRVRQGRRGRGGILRGGLRRGGGGHGHPAPAAGNPAPRLFRIPEARALINRMGFNNHGVDAMAGRLRALGRRAGPVGVNLGKNKDTPLERAVDDYVAGVERLGALADYVVVNASSPNTPGLRSLQEPEQLRALLATVRARLEAVSPGKPLLLKIAPDLAPEEVDAIVDVAVEVGIAGLICTNTTLARPGVEARSRPRRRPLRRPARPAGDGDAAPGSCPGPGSACALGLGRGVHRRRRARAARGRGGPGANLHGVRLRGSGLRPPAPHRAPRSALRPGAGCALGHPQA